jgi:hypothetical protein
MPRLAARRVNRSGGNRGAVLVWDSHHDPGCLSAGILAAPADPEADPP